MTKILLQKLQWVYGCQGGILRVCTVVLCKWQRQLLRRMRRMPSLATIVYCPLTFKSIMVSFPIEYQPDQSHHIANFGDLRRSRFHCDSSRFDGYLSGSTSQSLQHEVSILKSEVKDASPLNFNRDVNYPGSMELDVTTRIWNLRWDWHTEIPKPHGLQCRSDKASSSQIRHALTKTKSKP